MISEGEMINRYGAKFFIGQLVRIVNCQSIGISNDLGKVGVIQGISGDREDGFTYSLWPTESNQTAWFHECQLDFVNKDEKEEFEENYHEKENR